MDAQEYGVGLALLQKNEKVVKFRDNWNHYIDFEVMNDQIGRVEVYWILWMSVDESEKGIMRDFADVGQTINTTVVCYR